MKVADLFVKIGVQGADKSKKDLGKVKDGLTSIVDESTKVKIALLGILYFMDKLAGFASKTGLDLYKFGVTTGLSTKKLQEWQHAGMLFGVEGEEMSNTIKNVQDQMAKMKLGQGAPAGMGLLQQMPGFDPKKVEDTYYMMEQLQKYAKTHGAVLTKQVLGSFGMSDNMIQMLKLMNMERDRGNSKYFITPKQQEELVKMNMQYQELWWKIKQIGILGAGNIIGPMIDHFTKLLSVIENVITAISNFFSKFMSMKDLKNIFSTWMDVTNPITRAAKVFNFAKDVGKEVKDNAFDMAGSFMDEHKGLKEMILGPSSDLKKDPYETAGVNDKPGTVNNQTGGDSNTNVTINNYGEKPQNQNVPQLKRAISDAQRQRSFRNY